MIRAAVALAAILFALTGAACRGSDSEAEAEPVATVSEAELTHPRTLRICSDMSRPPMEYRTRAGSRKGFEVDIMEEVARRLALAPVWVDTRRAQLIGAVVRRECDVIASSLPVRLEDQHRINELAYLVVPISLLVRDEEAARLALGLCGKRVAAFPRSRELEIVSEYSDECRAQGRKAISPLEVQTTTEALRALEARRVDALLDAAASNDWYARRRPDRVEVAALLPEEERYAIGYGSGMNSVVLAVRGALLTMHQDGTFASLLARWGLEDTGVRGLPIP
jgi:polar amino acid transport system substrate-binding protein